MNTSTALFSELIRDRILDFEKVALFSFAHPSLLSAVQLNGLYEELENEFGNDVEYAHKIWRGLVTVQKELANDVSQYPFGAGPIERLYGPVKRGEMSIEMACEKAADDGSYSAISPLYVRCVLEACEKLVRESSGEWLRAVNFLKILLSGLQACPEPERDREFLLMWKDSVESWVGIVSMATHDVPDGRLYASALAHGTALLEELLASENPGRAWRIAHRLGVLHLDPYFAARSTSNYMVQFHQWQNRLADYFGRDLVTSEQQHIFMPGATAALVLAEKFLSEAVRISDGIEKARSCKALAETYNWKYRLNGEDVSDKVILYGQTALSLFIPEAEFPGERMAISNLLQNSPHKTSFANDPDLTFFLTSSAETILERYDQTKALDLLSQGTSFYVASQPEKALRLWQKSNDMLEKYPDDQRLLAIYTAGLQLVKALYSDKWIEPISSRDTPTLVQMAQKANAGEHWTQMKKAAVFISIAYYSTSKNEEDQGLSVLDGVQEIVNSRQEFKPFADSLLWLRANLHIGYAVNLLNANQPVDASEQYAGALKTFLSAGMKYYTLEMLRRFEDMVKAAKEDLLITITVSLTGQALDIERVGGSTGRELCQNIYRSAIRQSLAFGKGNAALLLLLLQYAKGFGFASMLDRDYRVRVQDEPDAKALLARIRELTASVESQGRDGAGPGFDFLDEEMLLNSYTGEYGRRKGATAAEMLENLKIKFDSDLYRALINEARHTGNFFLQPDQLQAVLGSRTVLIIQYFGVAPQGQAAIYTLLMTAEEIRVIMGMLSDLPSANVQMSDKETTELIPLISYLIADTRRELQEESYKREVTAAGRKRLGQDAGQFLGGDIPGILEQFAAAGKDHLCIVPHGGLHFYPYHLLPAGKGIIADNWKVSYLPNIKLLDPSLRQYGPGDKIVDETGTVHIGGISMQINDREQLKKLRSMEKQRAPVCVLGMSFTGNEPHGQQALQNAVSEARSIAAVFETAAITDHEATESAFWQAVTSSRMVHIATHGAHKVSAPVFQCLYLYPDANSDGIIHAYELFGVDLRGLELVTLSACETALGRVDSADNIRGFPAALLTAGVATIIGTLWQASDSSCELFFTTLYRKLREGEKKYEAFYAAQQLTRASFSRYRDWGAFYMMGK